MALGAITFLGIMRGMPLKLYGQNHELTLWCQCKGKVLFTAFMSLAEVQIFSFVI